MYVHVYMYVCVCGCARVCVCTFQPKHFTRWHSERVKRWSQEPFFVVSTFFMQNNTLILTSNNSRRRGQQRKHTHTVRTKSKDCKRGVCGLEGEERGEVGGGGRGVYVGETASWYFMPSHPCKFHRYWNESVNRPKTAAATSQCVTGTCKTPLQRDPTIRNHPPDQTNDNTSTLLVGQRFTNHTAATGFETDSHIFRTRASLPFLIARMDEKCLPK